MQVSDAGLKFIAGHEGSRNQPYNDPSGFATIGIGHLIGRRPVTQADREQWGTLTDQQVLDLFRQDIPKYSEPVAAAVKVPLSQNQFDALVSFAFNVGVGAFQKSTLLKKLNAGDYAGAAKEFAKWNKSAGRVLPGLTRRRAEEAAMFLRASEPVQQASPHRATLQRGPSDRFARAEWLHPVFRIRLEALSDAVPFTVTSGGRSTKRQAELYNLFLRGQGNPANRPGTSWHEYDPDNPDPWTLAQAADIEPKAPHTDAHLHKAAQRFGLHFPIEGEPWHIQPLEAESSKRTRGQGLGPVPTAPPITQEEEDDVIRYGLVAVPGQGIHGVYSVPERTELADGRVLLPGELAKVGFTNGPLLKAMENAGVARGPVEFLDQDAFDRIPFVANV